MNVNSRRIEDLHPKVELLCRKFIKVCEEEGFDILITSTYRSPESQNELFAQGRTRPGRVVTWARGGESLHNYRLAFDFAPINKHGKIDWGDIDSFRICGEIGERAGLQWAGRWPAKKREFAHLQFSGGLTIADLKAGKTIDQDH